MKLHQFPTAIDRIRIHDLIRFNACGKLSRVHMDEIIEQVLTYYGLTYIHLDGYIVHLAESITTPLGRFPVTYIIAQYESDGPNCPKCGCNGGFLEGDKVIVAGCPICGLVFKFRDKEVEQGANPQDAG